MASTKKQPKKWIKSHCMASYLQIAVGVVMPVNLELPLFSIKCWAKPIQYCPRFEKMPRVNCAEKNEQAQIKVVRNPVKNEHQPCLLTVQLLGKSMKYSKILFTAWNSTFLYIGCHFSLLLLNCCCSIVVVLFFTIPVELLEFHLYRPKVILHLNMSWCGNVGA